MEDARKRQRALVRSTMAARSFSSPQGDLDMHRLRRALERVSFDQTLGGRLEESDGETYSTPRGVLARRSLTDSSEPPPMKDPSTSALCSLYSFPPFFCVFLLKCFNLLKCLVPSIIVSISPMTVICL